MQPLTEEQILLTKTLPKKYNPVSLQGRLIRIEPYDQDRDVQILFDRTNGSSQSLGSRSIDAYDADSLVWRYMPIGPFPDLESFRVGINKLADLPDYTTFTIFHNETNTQIGIFSMMRNMPEFLRVEIGFIIISPVAQRIGVATEMIYLMASQCFGIGYNRLEWKCDNLNERSKGTALANGFTFEGIQQYIEG